MIRSVSAVFKNMKLISCKKCRGKGSRLGVYHYDRITCDRCNGTGMQDASILPKPSGNKQKTLCDKKYMDIEIAKKVKAV